MDRCDVSGTTTYPNAKPKPRKRGARLVGGAEKFDHRRVDLAEEPGIKLREYGLQAFLAVSDDDLGAAEETTGDMERPRHVLRPRHRLRTVSNAPLIAGVPCLQ